MSSVRSTALTRVLAEQRAAEIATLLNRIPLLSYTPDDVLADVSHRGKPLLGKWKQSLIATASDGRLAAVLIAHDKQADPPYYPEPSCYLSEIVVAEEWEGQGIARRLTEQWLTGTAGRLPHSLQTNSAESNAHVRSFYERLGFAEVSRKTYDNRVDSILFRYAGTPPRPPQPGVAR